MRDREIWNAAQVAAYCGRNVETIRQWARKGWIPYIRDRHRIVYDAERVQRWWASYAILVTRGRK